MENLHFLRYTHTHTDTHTYGCYIIRIYKLSNVERWNERVRDKRKQSFFSMYLQFSVALNEESRSKLNEWVSGEKERKQLRSNTDINGIISAY